MDRSFARPRITAVLGPTNTGKTYLAIERMLGHRSGMIGFPLRLLARENYDRVCRARGAHQVALITGEERIVPPNPKYFLCTVEAMPLDRRVAFLAVDEIQLCADPERGHVFTNRLLEARGEEETMLMGAATVAPMIAKLVPEASFVARSRLSQLSYAGTKKLTRLPRRSAVIAFSATNVYALAELLRRQRGGTAVVLGALSPRTRNAQVAMYEAGEVDYLVATDAVGMGLNMAIDHVAFSSLTKFDGRVPRRLTAPEIAQIAGRAGRHMADGTFGTTADLPPIEPPLVEALEEHRFDRLKSVFWRNADLEFHSLEALRRSLNARPPVRALARARMADDLKALTGLMKDDEVQRLAIAPDAIRLLWDVCQVPDFRKELGDGHARLVGRLFKHLMSPEGVVPSDWVGRSIGRLDRTDGDIDALMVRIAHTRTWTYVAHRGDWLDDSAGWQERARAIEDKLSDALHDRLTQRFVDRRTAALVQRLDAGEELLSAVTRAGDVIVEGAVVGRLDGFRLVAQASELTAPGPVRAAANRALRNDLGHRVKRCVDDPDAVFTLSAEGVLQWRGAPVGRLRRGTGPLRPEIDVLAVDEVARSDRDRLRGRLTAWTERHVASILAPLIRLEAATLSGAARGLAFQLAEGLGTVLASACRDQVNALSADERRQLSRLGVRFGMEAVFMPGALRRRPLVLRAVLAAAYLRLLAGPEGVGGSSFAVGASETEVFCLLSGYRATGPVAIRVDLLERLLAAVRRGVRQGPYLLSAAQVAPLGVAPPVLAEALRACGFRANVEGQEVTVTARARGNGAVRPARRRRRTRSLADSPFAKLRSLHTAK